jgi:hypothetical protein
VHQTLKTETIVRRSLAIRRVASVADRSRVFPLLRLHSFSLASLQHPSLPTLNAGCLSVSPRSAKSCLIHPKVPNPMKPLAPASPPPLLARPPVNAQTLINPRQDSLVLIASINTSPTTGHASLLGSVRLRTLLPLALQAHPTSIPPSLLLPLSLPKALSQSTVDLPKHPTENNANRSSAVSQPRHRTPPSQPQHPLLYPLKRLKTSTNPSSHAASSASIPLTSLSPLKTLMADGIRCPFRDRRWRNGRRMPRRRRKRRGCSLRPHHPKSCPTLLPEPLPFPSQSLMTGRRSPAARKAMARTRTSSSPTGKGRVRWRGS